MGITDLFYKIYAKDIVDSLENQLSLSTEHITRLQLLQDEGRLLTAGLIPAVDSNDPGSAGFIGSIIIAQFESLEIAQSWAKVDPYFSSGIYKNITVRPYKKIF